MTKYREILRLTALGLSLRDIEKSLKVSRKTVVKVQKRADELSLSWPLDESLTDAELEQRMFPKDLSPKSVKVKSFAPRQIQRRSFAALAITLSRKIF